MAVRDESRIPLLLNTDDNGDSESSDPLVEDVEVEYALRTPPRQQAARPDSGGKPAGGAAGNGRVKRTHYSGNEMIVAVFVVAFDTKKGTCIQP